jgi:hypothetical protein
LNVSSHHPVLAILINDAGHNDKVNPRNRRYSDLSKEFWKSVYSISESPRLVEFLSANLGGPSMRTIKNWFKEHIKFEPGLDEKNFKMIGEIYEKLKIHHNVKEPLPVLYCEDEVAVKEELIFEPEVDGFIGSCGKLADHKAHCNSNCILKIDNPDDYLNVHSNYKISKESRVGMLRPLDIRFPALPCVISATCKEFPQLCEQTLKKSWPCSNQICGWRSSQSCMPDCYCKES